MAHVLVVGGTGILKDVSMFLAQHDNTVSVIARDAERLTTLVKEAGDLVGQINPVNVDYNRTNDLSDALYEAIESYGPIILVVNWMKTYAVEGAETLSQIINNTSPICRYFQVLSTQNADHYPNEHFFMNPFGETHRILHRTIMLGGQLDNKGQHRELTNGEICHGIVDAIRNDRRNAVIGISEPVGGRAQSA